jgi:glutamate carboxypeptidase
MADAAGESGSVKTRELLAAAQRRQEAMLRLLSGLVRCESSSYDKAGVDRCARILAAEWAKRLGQRRVKLIRQRERGDHVRVEWRPSSAKAKGQILVVGHTDTVYEKGTLERMPFRVAGGRAFGPGIFDMKGGLVIALCAVDALRACGLEPASRVVFLWTSDEEIGSRTSRRIIEREARGSDAVLVLEPAAGPRGLLKTARKGVGDYALRVTGKAAHAGLDPGAGVNAVHEMALQIARVAEFNDPRRGTSVNVDLVRGGTRSNVIADEARAVVDVRCVRLSDARRLAAQFRALRPVLRGAKLEVTGGLDRPPMERTPATEALFHRAQRLGRAMGVELGETMVGGGSDGNFTAALGVPTLDGLGAVGNGAHSPDEFIVIRYLPERAALLAGLLVHL